MKCSLLQVVGGMVWCISVCSYDVDVDLLFQENSSIGQKMFVLSLYIHLLSPTSTSVIHLFASDQLHPDRGLVEIQRFFVIKVFSTFVQPAFSYHQNNINLHAAVFA